PTRVWFSASWREGPGPPCDSGRSPPPIEAIVLVALPTPRPWSPPAPPPPVPPPPPPPPPPVRLREETLMPPLEPGLLLVKRERDETGLPTSSAAPKRASAPRRGAILALDRLGNLSLSARMPTLPTLCCGVGSCVGEPSPGPTGRAGFPGLSG